MTIETDMHLKANSLLGAYLQRAIVVNVLTLATKIVGDRSFSDTLIYGMHMSNQINSAIRTLTFSKFLKTISTNRGSYSFD